MFDIATLANRIIMSRPPELAVGDSNHCAATQNADADIDQVGAVPADTSRPLDPQQPSNGAPRPDDNNKSTDQVGETGAGNFREVLEKRLSEKSDPHPEAEGDQTLTNTDESFSQHKQGTLVHLANTVPELPADLAQLKSPQTAVASTSHLVLVSLHGKEATKTYIKAKGTAAAGRTHLLSRAQPAQASVQGQHVQAQQLKSNAHADDVGLTFGKNSAAKTHKRPVSNKKAGADQAQTQLQLADSSPKKPASHIGPQLAEGKNADILPGMVETETLLPTAAKLPPTGTANAALASTNAKGIIPAGPKGEQTAPGKNQMHTPSDRAESATQKDTPDVQAAFATARTNAIIADIEGSNPATVEVTALGAKAPGVPSALTARQPNSANSMPAAAGTASIGGIHTTDNILPSPAQQIIDSIRLNIDTPQQQIYISLNPPELGRVRIMFRQIDGEITGLLEADKRQTKYDIEQSLPQIVASLHQCGVKVGRVNVILNDQNQQGPFKNNDVPDDDFVGMAKHGFTDQSSDDNSTRPNSPQADTAGSVNQQLSNITNEITDDTINVYV
jgi:flagellar hook-length control protein FliK